MLFTGTSSFFFFFLSKSEKLEFWKWNVILIVHTAWRSVPSSSSISSIFRLFSVPPRARQTWAPHLTWTFPLGLAASGHVPIRTPRGGVCRRRRQSALVCGAEGYAAISCLASGVCRFPTVVWFLGCCARGSIVDLHLPGNDRQGVTSQGLQFVTNWINHLRVCQTLFPQSYNSNREWFASS